MNPIYNQLTYQRIPLPLQGSSYTQENSNQQANNNDPSYYVNLKPNNIEPQRHQEEPQNTNLDNKLNQAPLPYQNQNLLLNTKLTIPLPLSTTIQQPKVVRSINPEESLQHQHQESSTRIAHQQLLTGVDPVTQEELNQLVTKIKELKTRVEELRKQILK